MSVATWEDNLLGELGAPKSKGNETKLADWSAAEGGLPFNNPFNTSLDASVYGGQPKAPSIANYPTLALGLLETVRTLTGSSSTYGYAPIVQNLRSDGSTVQFAQDLEASSWDAGHYANSDVIQALARGGSPQVAGGAAAGLPTTGTQQSPGTTDPAGSNSGTTGSGTTSPVSFVTSLFGGVTTDLERIGEMILGVVMIGLGVVGIYKALSTSAAVTNVQAVIEPVTSRVGGGSSSSSSPSPIAKAPRRAKRKAGFTLAADQKPKRGSPGSKMLAEGDSLPY